MNAISARQWDPTLGNDHDVDLATNQFNRGPPSFPRPNECNSARLHSQSKACERPYHSLRVCYP